MQTITANAASIFVGFYIQIRQPAYWSYRHDEVEMLLTVVYVHFSIDISEPIFAATMARGSSDMAPSEVINETI
jgi:hypothetical protein